MLPSEALQKILRIRAEIDRMPYDAVYNSNRLKDAYKEFDDAIHSSLLDLIKNNHEPDTNHHERLVQPWLDDPEYKKALHQYDHELNKSNKGDE